MSTRRQSGFWVIRREKIRGGAEHREDGTVARPGPQVSQGEDASKETGTGREGRDKRHGQADEDPARGRKKTIAQLTRDSWTIHSDLLY